jgi:hypothetical protein
MNYACFNRLLKGQNAQRQRQRQRQWQQQRQQTLKSLSLQPVVALILQRHDIAKRKLREISNLRQLLHAQAFF